MEFLLLTQHAGRAASREKPYSIICRPAYGIFEKRRKDVMECHYELQEGCLTIWMPKELDHHSAEQLRKEADLL